MYFRQQKSITFQPCNVLNLFSHLIFSLFEIFFIFFLSGIPDARAVIHPVLPDPLCHPAVPLHLHGRQPEGLHPQGVRGQRGERGRRPQRQASELVQEADHQDVGWVEMSGLKKIVRVIYVLYVHCTVCSRSTVY